MKRVRFGIIGTGRIASAYAGVFAQSRNAELVAVYDVAPEVAAAFAGRFGVQAYDSYTKMVREAPLDAVLICTPPLWHEPIAVECMQLGCHVLCEKPLSIEAAAAKRMIEKAQSSGVVFTMASKFRYVEDIVRARELANAGAIGEVVLFENAFTSHVAMRDRWNSNARISGGGVLIDNGTHSVDVMRYFLGVVDVVKVVAGRNMQGLDVEDTAHLFARSELGVMGAIDLSWSIDKQSRSYVQLHGSEGTISIGWRASGYKLAGSKTWVRFGEGYNRDAAFGKQIENFAAACLGEEPLRVTPDDALASVEVIAAAYAAMRGDRWTPVYNTISVPDTGLHAVPGV
jgi:predicted dehydrogenase